MGKVQGKSTLRARSKDSLFSPLEKDEIGKIGEMTQRQQT